MSETPQTEVKEPAEELTDEEPAPDDATELDEPDEEPAEE
jgi:hypothetical protein